ncbi:hypothetical protein D9M70_427630 [compost metagenome]
MKVVKLPHAQFQWPFDQPADRQPVVITAKVRNIEVVTQVEPTVRHHGTACKVRHRGLAIQRINAVNEKASLDGILARICGVEHLRRHVHRAPITAAARNHRSAGHRCRHLDLAGLTERRQKSLKHGLIRCRGNEEQ